MKEEIFFIVTGPPRRTTPEGAKSEATIGVFEALELALDYGRSLSRFRVYRAPINGFTGAELIIQSTHPENIEWVGRPDHTREIQDFKRILRDRGVPDDREASFEQEEHLDWEI